jgi:hypothetical protein
MDVDGAGGLEKACRRWQHRAREFWLSVQRRRDGNDMGNLYEGAWAYMVAMDWPMASTLGFGLRACSGPGSQKRDDEVPCDQWESDNVLCFASDQGSDCCSGTMVLMCRLQWWVTVCWDISHRLWNGTQHALNYAGLCGCMHLWRSSTRSIWGLGPRVDCGIMHIRHHAEP